MYLGAWHIDDELTFTANTHSLTGSATDADSPPTYRVYERSTATAISTGTMATMDVSNTIGFYTENVTLSAATGFEEDSTYIVYMTAVVGGATATNSHIFKIEPQPSVASATATNQTTIIEKLDEIQGATFSSADHSLVKIQSNLATVDAVADTISTNVSATQSSLSGSITTLNATQASVSTAITDIAATQASISSAIIDVDFLKDIHQNKKELFKDTGDVYGNGASAWYLRIYTDASTATDGFVLIKQLQKQDGSDIDDVTANALAIEIRDTVLV